MCLKTVFLKTRAHLMKIISPVGQCFPHTSTEGVRDRCVIFECDGPSLMFGFVHFDMFLASVGHVTPHNGAESSSCL